MTLDANKSEEKVLFAIQQEYKILAEYKMVESEKIGGMYVIPSYSTSLHWFGVLFVREGYYAGGVFRFSLLLPDKFPDEKSVPTIIFQNPVFHPLICPYTHSLELSQAFPQWRAGEDHIWQLLKYIQAIFLDPMECIKSSDFETLNNKEAAEMLRENVQSYEACCKEHVTKSQEQIYDTPKMDDPHYIVFEKYDNDIHGPIFERIKAGKEPINSNQPPATGLSWVKEGEFQPLSVE